VVCPTTIKSKAEDHGHKPVGESVLLFAAERCNMIKSGNGNQTQRTWSISPRVSCCLDPEVSQEDTERGGKDLY